MKLHDYILCFRDYVLNVEHNHEELDHVERNYVEHNHVLVFMFYVLEHVLRLCSKNTTVALKTKTWVVI